MSKDNTVFIGKTKNFWDRNRRSNGYLLKRRIGQIAVSVIRALLMFGLCFMIIQPMITSSRRRSFPPRCIRPLPVSTCSD